MINRGLAGAVRALLWLRYRVRVRGADAVAARGTRGILLLPNHPALIDPVILLAHLWPWFRPRAVADQDQVDRPVIRTLARRARVLTMPGTETHGAGAARRIAATLNAAAEALRAGDNVIVYPAGRVYRQGREDLRNAGAAARLLRAVPDARVVLVRTRGLWGSRFSWAGGTAPRIGPVLRRGALALLAHGLLGLPRREVTIELAEPADLPRHADRATLNRYLERFYNEA